MCFASKQHCHAPRRRDAVVLLVTFLSAALPGALNPRTALGAPQCGPYGCSPGGSVSAPSLPKSAQPFAAPEVGGTCAGGSCPPPNLGFSGTEPFVGQFQPRRGLFEQPLSFLQSIFRAPAFLAGVLTTTIAEQLVRGLFGKGTPDITEISPRDPRGRAVIRRQPSLRARRGQPPSPRPGDFSVERLEQRGLPEEKGVSPGIGPTGTGPGEAPPVQPVPPPRSCPGGVCPAR